jgi:hypothetical protein
MWLSRRIVRGAQDVSCRISRFLRALRCVAGRHAWRRGAAVVSNGFGVRPAGDGGEPNAFHLELCDRDGCHAMRIARANRWTVFLERVVEAELRDRVRAELERGRS